MRENGGCPKNVVTRLGIVDLWLGFPGVFMGGA